MNRISLSSNNYTNCISIPNIFIDQYMPSANGSYVKVYLYLIRCLNDASCEMTISAIADHLDNTENDIIRALCYWEKTGLLALGRSPENVIVSIDVLSLSEPAANTVKPEHQESAAAVEPVVKETAPEEELIKPQYTEAQITEITSDDEVKWMMHIIELYLERPLKPMDVQLILYLYESLSFSRELIMYLYEYCISKNKKSPSYIEAVALAWHKDGIDSVEKAEAASSIYNTGVSAVNKAFGLNRAPGNVEQQYINKWMLKYKMSVELIEEACNRTILATQKPDFKYADKILENWSAKGVKSKKDIEALDSAHKKTTQEKYSKPSATPAKGQTAKPSNNKFNAFPQREYTEEDYSSLEQKLLNIEYIGKKR